MYDGTLGVIGAIEALRALKQAVSTLSRVHTESVLLTCAVLVLGLQGPCISRSLCVIANRQGRWHEACVEINHCSAAAGTYLHRTGVYKGASALSFTT